MPYRQLVRALGLAIAVTLAAHPGVALPSQVYCCARGCDLVPRSECLGQSYTTEYVCVESCLDCIPSWDYDDTLDATNCCSGVAVPNSTTCDNPNDYNTTWASCHQVCE